MAPHCTAAATRFDVIFFTRGNSALHCRINQLLHTLSHFMFLLSSHWIFCEALIFKVALRRDFRPQSYFRGDKLISSQRESRFDAVTQWGMTQLKDQIGETLLPCTDCSSSSSSQGTPPPIQRFPRRQDLVNSECPGLNATLNSHGKDHSTVVAPSWTLCKNKHGLYILKLSIWQPRCLSAPSLGKKLRPHRRRKSCAAASTAAQPPPLFVQQQMWDLLMRD